MSLILVTMKFGAVVPTTISHKELRPSAIVVTSNSGTSTEEEKKQ